MFVGSCFSEHMSNLLKKGKFPITSNPHGIMFNPISISNSIEDVVKLRHYTKSDLFTDLVTKDIHHSWSHHSSFSRTNEEIDDMVSNINSHIEVAHRSLVSSKILFVTLGTAFVHQLISNSKVVSNCHKRKYIYTSTTTSSSDIYGS